MSTVSVGTAEPFGPRLHPRALMAVPGDVPEAGDDVNAAGCGPPVTRWSQATADRRWTVDAYLGSFSESTDSQDAFLVAGDADHAVLAVADGVTPTARTPREPVTGRLDGAQYAVRCVMHAVRQTTDPDPSVALATAHRALRSTPFHHPWGGTPRDRPQAAAALVTVALPPDGTVGNLGIARAADCEVWVRRAGRWSLRTPTPMLRAGPRRGLRAWDRANPDAPYYTRFGVEASLGLDDHTQWNTAAIGRFDEPVLETISLDTRVDEVIVATDGARLRRCDPTAYPTPLAWLSQLRGWEMKQLPSHRQHSDVALLHLRPVGDVTAR